MSADHILTFAQDLSGGGVERAQLRLAAEWLAAGRRVTLAVGDAGGPLAADLPAGLGLEPLGHRRYVAQRRLAAITLRLRPDLIFCPGNHYTLVAAWLRWRLGDDCPPIVAKLSNAIDRADHGRIMGAGHRLWLAQHGRFLDHLVAMTPATAALAARAMRMERRTSVIPNPPAPRATAAAAGGAALPDYEGVPGVLREALSVGTPVVATASSPAVREIVGDARLGTVVAPEDAAGLAAALNHWLVAPRPAPVPQPGGDSAARYLRLFDTLA
ncbi:MAG: glycosyltransferase [Sphingomonas sp.]|nr:MAG: glycosyltransferase [Sphingomonas sp.]